MQSLLTRTWALLQNNWILLSVLILEALVQLVFRGGSLGFSANPLLEFALFFFHLAVLAGWLYQMKAAVLRENHRSSWDDFLNGVARYFSTLMSGGSMYFFVGFMGFILSSMIAQLIAGTPNEQLLQQISSLWEAGKTTEIEALLLKHQDDVRQMGIWFAIFVLGMLAVGAYLLSLCFWTYWAVLGNLNWRGAWQRSQQTLKRHWKILLYLGMIWLVPSALVLVGLFSNNPVLQFVAYFASLLSKVYFTLLFVQFLILAEPEQITPLMELEPQEPGAGGPFSEG